MAYKSITDDQIARGRGAKQELFQQVRDNQEDLNERIGATGGESANIVNQVAIGNFPAGKVIETYRTTRPVILQEAVLSIIEVFSDAAEEMILDILHGTTADISAATTIFKTKPTVPASAGETSGNAEFLDDLGELPPGTYIYVMFEKYQANVKASHIILR